MPATITVTVISRKCIVLQQSGIERRHICKSWTAALTRLRDIFPATVLKVRHVSQCVDCSIVVPVKFRQYVGQGYSTVIVCGDCFRARA